MDNCKVIMVTSCKGGVGKSTVSANLAIELAKNGHRTLLMDCDFGVRSLDLIMGLEDEVIFDITDIISRGISPADAMIGDPRSENLFFCSAPYSYENDIEPEAFRETVLRIGEEMQLAYIIIDTPGDTGIPFKLAARTADLALVISTYQPASIRAAERTGILLHEAGLSEKNLIINCFNTESTEYDLQPSITEIIDKTGIQLVGVIPYDVRVSESQALGRDIFTIGKCNAAVAVRNIARRVTGKSVPLFTGFRKFNRVKMIKKIQ